MIILKAICCGVLILLIVIEFPVMLSFLILQFIVNLIETSLSKLFFNTINLLHKTTDSLQPIDGVMLMEFYTIIDGQNTKVVHMFLKDSDSLPLSVALVDAKGNAAKADGAPSWAVTDPSLASLVVAADGMSAVLSATGPLGAFKVQVTADADLGSGVKSILGELDVEIIAGEAVTVNVVAGEAVPQ